MCVSFFWGCPFKFEGLANETAGKIIVNGCVAWSGEGGGSAGPPQLLSSSAPRSSAPQLLSSSGLCRWPEWEAMLSNESPIWVRDTCGTVAVPDTGGE